MQKRPEQGLKRLTGKQLENTGVFNYSNFINWRQNKGKDPKGHQLEILNNVPNTFSFYDPKW